MGKIVGDDIKDIASITAAASFALLLTGPAGTVAGAFAAASIIIGRKLLPSFYERLFNSLPQEVRLYVPSVLIALEQLRSNLDGSPLISPVILENAERTIAYNYKFLNPSKNLSPLETDIDRLFRNHLWAVADKRDVQIVKETDGVDPPLRIDCLSICTGAYVTLQSMKKRYGLKFSIDSSRASGREQVIARRHLFNESSSKLTPVDHDILIGGDTPLVLGESQVTFQKRFTVTNEPQALLYRVGGEHRAQKVVHLYPRSTATHHMMLMAEKSKSVYFPLGQKLIESPIYDLADYMNLERIMLPGDYVFAWGPLLTKLLSVNSFRYVPNTSYVFPISLYTKDPGRFAQQHIDAFLRLFIVEINRVKKNKVAAWKILMSDSNFRQSLIRGSALGVKIF